MQIFSCPMNRMSRNVGLFEPIDLMFNERNKEMKRMSMPPSGQLSPATRRQKGESPQLIFLASDGAPKKKKVEAAESENSWPLKLVKMCQKVIHSTRSNGICSKYFAAHSDSSNWIS